MSAIDRLRALARPSRLVVTALLGLSAAGIALAADTTSPADQVRLLLKTRLPKTLVTAIDCGKINGLCEITAGANLFYVDTGARFLVIGRIYDMQTRQDITAARLLEMNPDMLVGAA
ncbi:MAG: disulfide bond formation protein DsbC, partial [Sphingobium sp. 32-64-5]